AAGQLARQRDRQAAAAGWLAAKRDDLTAARRSTLDAATRARIAAEYTERIDRALDGHPDPAALRRDADRQADRQQRAIRRVAGRIEAAEEAARALVEARRKVSELDAEADDLAERRTDADEAVRARGAELVSAVRGHLERSLELRLPDPAATLAELELWVDTLAGPNPAATAGSATRQAAARDPAPARAAPAR